MDHQLQQCRTGEPGPVSSVAGSFDGVICFGGSDWWYHNRGHYDLQMMRELSRLVPVLYVNSIGIRVPKLSQGVMSFRRVARKLRSLRRGLVRIHDRFAVYSPIALPGKIGMASSRRLLIAQVKLASRRMGIGRPLVWVACPSGVEAVNELDPVGIVYERTDRWESFPDADPELILSYHRRLQQMAHVTLYCSTRLFHEESPDCRNAAYVDHGLDYDRFASAANSSTEPPETRALPRPLAGFIGAIDASTFDSLLFVELAHRLGDIHFVLVGACTLPDGWVDLPNVTLLGQRPYEDVGAYMAACDVLIMPWNQNDWIQACNPVKLKEYLAVGRPIVSTPFYELHRYTGYVQTATGAEEFALRIREALAAPVDPEHLRERVRSETWGAKIKEVLEHLAAQGIIAKPAGDAGCEAGGAP